MPVYYRSLAGVEGLTEYAAANPAQFVALQ
jgi:hypothetical protein